MAETVRDAFEEWAHADHRRLEPNEYEADDRTPGNNHYYDDDTTNQAYIGWCAAWNRRATDPAVPELVEALRTVQLARINGLFDAAIEHQIAGDVDGVFAEVDAALAKHAAKP